MSRPLRIDYPGAWHHVMNRSRKDTDLYCDNDDYLMFHDLLQETSAMYHLNVAAYCMMPNHYHLLVQSSEGNLARCMRHLNGIYTQKFNIRHKCDGTHFRGRYKSVLVQDDSYLLELVRYIHRNPLKADLSKTPGDYKWSSFKGYVSRAAKWDWLYKDFILSIFTENKKQQVSSYKSFMELEVSEEIDTFYQKKHLPTILGSNNFVSWVKKTFFHEKSNHEIPESKQLAPDIDLINKVVADVYQIELDDLFVVRRGYENEPRNVAVYLTRQLKGGHLKEIGEVFNLKRYSSVSSVLERVNRKMAIDKKFGKRVLEIKEKLSKGQK